MVANCARAATGTASHARPTAAGKSVFSHSRKRFLSVEDILLSFGIVLFLVMGDHPGARLAREDGGGHEEIGKRGSIACSFRPRRAAAMGERGDASCGEDFKNRASRSVRRTGPEPSTPPVQAAGG